MCGDDDMAVERESYIRELARKQHAEWLKKANERLLRYAERMREERREEQS